MFERNELTHVTVWPNGENPGVQLISPDGEVVADYALAEPMEGNRISRLIPQGYCVSFEDATVIKLTGDVLVGTRAEFDTAVVTERAEVTFEERMQRMEVRQKRFLQSQQQLAKQNAALKARLAEQEATDEVTEIPEDPPAGEVAETPQATPEATTEAPEDKENGNES